MSESLAGLDLLSGAVLVVGGDVQCVQAVTVVSVERDGAVVVNAGAETVSGQ